MDTCNPSLRYGRDGRRQGRGGATAGINEGSELEKSCWTFSPKGEKETILVVGQPINKAC